MAQAVNERQAAALLAQSDRILILCHQKPDGDTLGSGFALLYALLAMGKTARIACPDGFPPRYCFLYPGFVPERQPDFTPSCIVAVDVADLQLLGAWAGRLAGKIDLCIDHHPSNTGYAARLLLDAKAAATVEIIDRVLRELGAQVDYRIAVCIYTGLATDTGCFRYSNTTPASHLLAARMMEHGIDSYRINKLMFETKSPARMELERMVMDTLEYYENKRIAFIAMTLDAIEKTGVPEEDMEGIAAIPRQIEGVDAAVTFQQKGPERWRVSMRSSQYVDASAACARLGGGGHARAAGCTLEGTLEAAKARVLGVLRDVLGTQDSLKAEGSQGGQDVVV